MEIKDLAGFSEPAKTLIERVADLIGVVWKPAQIKFESQAQAYADARSVLIKQSLDPNATEEERQLARGLLSDAKRIGREQKNKEAIFAKALPEVKEDAKPEEVEDDWFANFFDKSRLVSDAEMQMLWAKVLAGEVNNPGIFSKRLLNLLSIIDKQDAEAFQKLSCFSAGPTFPGLILIYDYQDEIYLENGIEFAILVDLQSLGLIEFHVQSDFMLVSPSRNLILIYDMKAYFIDFPTHVGSNFYRGQVMLTSLGEELACLCSTQTVNGFGDYIYGKLTHWGYKIQLAEVGEQAQNQMIIDRANPSFRRKRRVSQK